MKINLKKKEKNADIAEKKYNYLNILKHTCFNQFNNQDKLKSIGDNYIEIKRLKIYIYIVIITNIHMKNMKLLIHEYSSLLINFTFVRVILESHVIMIKITIGEKIRLTDTLLPKPRKDNFLLVFSIVHRSR